MADVRAKFHPEARLDALAAHDYYSQKSVMLGEAFERELANAVAAIATNPTTWAGYLFGTRRYLMHRFPFVLVYRQNGDHLEILAVAHGQQRPGYWKDRADKGT